MQFYWLRDRYEQKQFDVFWESGKYNLADYPTKHHPGSHHKKVWPIYLYEEDKSPKTMQGCNEILGAHKTCAQQTDISNNSHKGILKQLSLLATWSSILPHNLIQNIKVI